MPRDRRRALLVTSEPHRQAPPRAPGVGAIAPEPVLARALDRIAAGEATALLTPALGAVASSLAELVALLDWLDAAGADLIALDVELDTATDAGRRSVALLRELARWEREPSRGRPPRGRPGLAAHDPALGERIAAMRAGGASLQAIADALNAERVATPRGGALWRPSSVQAALGYRRPRPPLAGAPLRPRKPPQPPDPRKPPQPPDPRKPSQPPDPHTRKPSGKPRPHPRRPPGGEPRP